MDIIFPTVLSCRYSYLPRCTKTHVVVIHPYCHASSFLCFSSLTEKLLSSKCLKYEKPKKRSLLLLGRVSQQVTLKHLFNDQYNKSKVGIFTFKFCLTPLMAVRIKKRSRVPGVMITQYVEVIPEGMSTPDFSRKPISITIQEGNLKFLLESHVNVLLL